MCAIAVLASVGAPPAFAGDVTAELDRKGVIRIAGTADADSVRIRPGGAADEISISPVGATTVNGGSSAVILRAQQGVRIALGDGDDVVDWDADADIRGPSRIDMGPGAAVVTIDDASFGGGLDVRLPRGGGSVVLTDCLFSGNLRLRATDAVSPVSFDVSGTQFLAGFVVAEGAADRTNRVRLTNLDLDAGGVTWRGGSVDDDVEFRNVFAGGRLAAYPGPGGTHRLAIFAGDFGEGARVEGGSGNDTFLAETTGFYGRGLTVETGRAGLDEVSLRESRVEGPFRIGGSRGGSSRVTCTGVVATGPRATLSLGRGDDFLHFEACTFGGALAVESGAGDDELRADGCGFGGAVRIDGGTGSDLFCDGFDALCTYGAARSVVRVERDRRASAGDDTTGCGGGTRRVSLPRISLTQSGGDADAASLLPSGKRVLEEDGEAMVFASAATNLVAGDTNGGSDIFVASIVNDVLVERVSLTSGGAELMLDFRGDPQQSANPTLSSQARFIAFESTATDAVPGDANGMGDVFLRDRLFGTTTAMSDPTVQPFGEFGTFTFAGASDPAISGEGRDVAFVSYADYLDEDPDYTSFFDQQIWVAYYSFDGTVFRRRATVRSDGQTADVAFGFSGHPSLSFFGRECAFHSTIVLTPNAPPATQYKVYVRDFGVPRTTELVSVTAEGTTFEAFNPTISDDGNLVSFETAAGIDPEDADGQVDIYVKNRTTGAITWASRDPEGGFPAFGPAPSQSFLSGSGRHVVFSAAGSSVRPNEAQFFHRDIYLFDLSTGMTIEVGTGAAGESRADSRTPSITPNGRWIGFESSGNDFEEGRIDGNGFQDVWVQDRGGFVVPPPPEKR
ncbi:MAG: hypothetical protein HMLKMBBP_01934 [Planctomycetes bacterium]|nr:hypothetical protein [Planctomycetota bacterium]